MKQAERRWWVGAYALTASLPSFSEAEAQGFYEALQALPQLAGLELPVHRQDKPDDPWRHLQFLPRNFDYILTPLPFVMQSLEQQPLFGLASPDEEGRAAALRLVDELRIRVQRLEDHCGRAAVRAVELHSAPTAQATPEALRRSLDLIMTMEWGQVELWIEHCDRWQDGQKAAKGFLNIEAELALAQEFDLGILINWGRSVLETRRAEGALLHLAAAEHAGVLQALFLSSVAVQDPLYGTWLDNHAPVQGLPASPWQARNSLLDQRQLTAALTAAQHVPYWGLKVQPAPATLTPVQRLDFLREHLAYLSRNIPV